MTTSRGILTRHGHSTKGAWSPTYYTWAAMVQRCTNPARNNAHLYSQAGVKMCAAWLDFNAFLRDMGERPSSEHSLDRFPNTAGDYEPGNCRWATATQQAQNRCNVKLSAEKAAEIRALRASGLSYPEIGRRFNVSKTMVRNVALRRSWI